jgi:hypothetical protein
MLLQREQSYYWPRKDKIVRPAELEGADAVAEFIDILTGERYVVCLEELQLISTEENTDDQIDILLKPRPNQWQWPYYNGYKGYNSISVGNDKPAIRKKTRGLLGYFVLFWKWIFS